VRAVHFYEHVLGFAKVTEAQVAGDAYDALSGVPASHMRIVYLRLGEQIIELTEYLSHQGRPIPVPWRGNDLWFQHVAIVVSDMEKAYERPNSESISRAASKRRNACSGIATGSLHRRAIPSGA